jgi:hypothetical protein
MSDIDDRRGAPRDARVSNGGSGGADPAVTRFLRESYRAPDAGSGYWEGLETRIMARVRESVRQSVRVSGNVPAVAVEWWQVLSGWVAPGAWAAGIAVLVALGAMLQARAAERRVAYAAVLEASAVGTSVVGGETQQAQEALRPDRIARPSSPSSADRDAALRDLLSPR